LKLETWNLKFFNDATDRVEVHLRIPVWRTPVEKLQPGMWISTEAGIAGQFLLTLVVHRRRGACALTRNDVRHPRWFEYGAGAGYLSAITNDGTGSESPVSRVAANEVTGIGSSPAWWHTTAFAAIDTRHSPGYTDSGGLYSVRLHDYIDRERTFDFTRTEIDLRQFVPILHDNWIVALQARADLTGTATGHAIPFFMLPAIGGRDTLPGFTDYRFTDRDSLLMRSELRWTPSPLINMAVFLDQGTVAPSAGALSFNDLKRGWGLGARFHGDTYTALRLEVAHSAEGAAPMSYPMHRP